MSIKKHRTKTPLNATLDVARLRGVPDLKILLYLSLYGESTADELVESKVLDLSDGNVRSALSSAVSRDLVLKCKPRPEDKKSTRGASPHRYKISGHGVKHLRESGIKYTKPSVW